MNAGAPSASARLASAGRIRDLSLSFRDSATGQFRTLVQAMGLDAVDPRAGSRLARERDHLSHHGAMQVVLKSDGVLD